jgi:hypothetical protein
MRAVDVRYNLMMLGNKVDEEMFYLGEEDMSKARRLYKEDKEECLTFLSSRGCPERVNGKIFKDHCYHFEDNCKECWRQEANEHLNWEEEEDDENGDWEDDNGE